MKSQMIYSCEICGRHSENKQDIIRCEAKSVPAKLLSKGDKIIFKDCEKTPIAYSKIKDYNIVNESEKHFWIRAFYTCCQGEELEIIEVILKGHNIIYKLGKNGRPLHMYGNFNESDIYYPTVYGNEFMQKIIEGYDD